MKKVKLLGLLASSVMILAGCNGGEPSTEPTSTEPPAPEWSEEDAKAIKDFVHANLPAFADLKLEELGEDDTYLRMKGKAGTDATVEAYGELLEEIKFKAAGFVPEDIDPDYDADTVVYYAKNINAKTTEMAYVTVGLEDGTNKLLVCATYGSCFMDDFFWAKNRVSIWTFNAKYDEFNGYIADYLLWANGSKAYTDESLDDDAVEARAAEEASYFVWPEVAAVVADPEKTTGVLFADYQFGYPFTYGNAYSDEFHSIIDVGYYEATAEEEEAYVTALEVNYTKTKEKYIDDEKTILERFYKREVEGFGTYYAAEFFYPGMLGSGADSTDVLAVSYDYDGPKAAA